MTKLLNADIHELLRSRYFYIALGACAFFGVFLAAGMYLYPNFNMPEGSQIVITKETVLGIVPSFAAVIIPFAAGSTVAVLLDSQYVHGIIRNKLACGHTRTEIFFSDLVTMTAATVIYFAAYELGAFAVAVLAFGYEGYELKAALATLGVMLVMLICISTVLSLLVGNLMRGGKIPVAILVVQYLLNLSIVFGMFKADNKGLELISRAFPQSCIFDFSYSVIPDGLEKDLAVSVVLMVIFILIGVLHFRKCDIR